LPLLALPLLAVPLLALPLPAWPLLAWPLDVSLEVDLEADLTTLEPFLGEVFTRMGLALHSKLAPGPRIHRMGQVRMLTFAAIIGWWLNTSCQPAQLPPESSPRHIAARAYIGTVRGPLNVRHDTRQQRKCKS